MTHVTRWLTAKNRDQLRNPTLDNRVGAIPYTPSEVPCNFSVVVRASGACLPSADSHTHDTLVGLRFIISGFADALTTPTIKYFVAASLCNSKLPVTLYTGRI